MRNRGLVWFWTGLSLGVLFGYATAILEVKAEKDHTAKVYVADAP